MIRNGIFAEIDANLEESAQTAANVIDLTDADTIIPGMIDLHAHYNFDLVDNGRAEEVVYNGIIFLANGVTSTWSAGEFFPERVLERRDLVDAGEAVGPRLFASGPYFGGFRCEYDVHLRDATLMGIDRIEHQVTLGSGGPGSADMQQMIDLILEHQVYYDANLQMYGGINLRQELGAVMVWVDEARYFTPYAQELLDKRGPPLPESDEPEFAQRMLELRKLYEAGGGNLLIVGTDEPVYTTLLPGFAFHRELLAMVHAGLPNIAVLKAATFNGAEALGVADRLGSIEVGKLADLYVARGNPLEDIKTARNVRLVIKSGVVYDPESLLKSAEGKIGPAGPDDHADWELHIEPLRKE